MRQLRSRMRYPRSSGFPIQQSARQDSKLTSTLRLTGVRPTNSKESTCGSSSPSSPTRSSQTSAVCGYTWPPTNSGARRILQHPDPAGEGAPRAPSPDTKFLPVSLVFFYIKNLLTQSRFSICRSTIKSSYDWLMESMLKQVYVMCTHVQFFLQYAPNHTSHV